MTSAVANMPSSISSGSTEHRRSDSEAGPRGFTAVNITPPQSRESSATSPDVSPRHSTASAGRHNNASSWNINSHEPSQHKRRRSMSSEQGLPSPRRYDYNPPKKIETQQQHMADRALHVLDNTTNQHPPHSYYSAAPSGQDHSGYGYERHYNGPPGAHSSTPEGRLAEAFSRETSEHHYASSANGVDPERLDDNKDGSQGLQPGQKRKRNFSNRTKTGCITCRGRKKKCDEGRPHCNNCIRGGFACQGYNHTRPSNWTKPTPQKQPILLQSKENDEQSPYENTITPVSANPSSAEASQMRPNAADPGHGHDQSRPQYAPNSSNTTDSRPPYSGQQQHQPQWPQHPHHPPSQHGPTPQSAYPSDHLPPFSELPRPEHSQQHSQHPQQQQQQQQQHQRPEYSTTPQHENSRPPMQAHSTGPTPSGPPSQSQPQPPPQWQQQQPPPPPPPQQHQQQPSQSPPQPQQQQQPPYQAPPQPSKEYPARPPYPPRIDTSSQYPTPSHRINTANTAMTATATTATPYSSYEPTSKGASRTFTMEDVERSKMLRGAQYNYFDPTLENERQRCANALLRYNNACQLGSGVSKPEQQNMLSKVFLPSKDTTHSFVASLKGHEGSLGPGVRIEPGFDCTYGYNIKIYDNVFIGKNTRIDDSAKVEIGARTWIGAGVTILTNEMKADVVNRHGTNGTSCSAQPVSIGAEVMIGPGAFIYPGVKLGKHSTVEAGAVVKSHLPDGFTQLAAVGQQRGPDGGVASGSGWAY